jgi:hypothetical protein
VGNDLKKGWGMLLKNYPLKLGNAREKSQRQRRFVLNAEIGLKMVFGRNE